jgi:integrase
MELGSSLCDRVFALACGKSLQLFTSGLPVTAWLYEQQGFEQEYIEDLTGHADVKMTEPISQDTAMTRGLT